MQNTNLTNLTDGNLPKTMTSREIAELCDKRHGSVLRTIEFLIQENATHGVHRDFTTEKGNVYQEWVFDKNNSLIVVARLEPKFMAAVILRWQELESQQFSIPKTLGEALRLAADQQDTIEKQSKQLAIAAPKVKFHDMVTDASNCHTFEEAAKLFGIGRNTLFDLLRENKIMPAKSRLPYQHYMRYFKVIETPYLAASGVTKLATKTVINGDGFAYIQKRFFQTSSKESIEISLK